MTPRANSLRAAPKHPTAGIGGFDARTYRSGQATWLEPCRFSSGSKSVRPQNAPAATATGWSSTRQEATCLVKHHVEVFLDVAIGAVQPGPRQRVAALVGGRPGRVKGPANVTPALCSCRPESGRNKHPSTRPPAAAVCRPDRQKPYRSACQPVRGEAADCSLLSGFFHTIAGVPIVACTCGNVEMSGCRLVPSGPRTLKPAPPDQHQRTLLETSPPSSSGALETAEGVRP